MPALLTVPHSRRPADRFTLRDGDSYVLGRGPQAQIRLDDRRISRSHARLAWEDEGWVLEDLGSKNGVRVDGHRVVAPVSVVRACSLSLGGLELRFEQLSPEAWDSWCQAVRGMDSAEGLGEAVEGEGETAPGGLDRLLGELLRSALRVTGAERGFVLLDPGSGDLEVAATAGLAAEALAAPSFQDLALRVEEAFDRCRGELAVVDLPGGERRRFLCAPLPAALPESDRLDAAGEPALGVLYLDAPEGGEAGARSSFSRLTALEQEILDALVHHAALAVRAARLRTEANRLAASVPTRTVALVVEGDLRPIPGGPVRWKELTAQRWMGSWEG